MIVFKVILCGFPPIVSFWEFDKAGALIFGIDLGVFGWKSGWGDFFLWFFLLERGGLSVLYIKSNVSGFLYLFHDFSVDYS